MKKHIVLSLIAAVTLGSTTVMAGSTDMVRSDRDMIHNLKWDYQLRQNRHQYENLDDLPPNEMEMRKMYLRNEANKKYQQFLQGRIPYVDIDRN